MRSKDISKRAVAADMLATILSLTVIVLLMIFYWFLTAPELINSAAFSGDVVDFSAEQFSVALYNTPTVDGNFLDSLKKFVLDSENYGEDYARNKLLRKILPENPLRYHKADWVVVITEGDLVVGIVREQNSEPVKTFIITNPYFEAFNSPKRHEDAESLRTKVEKRFNSPGYDVKQSFKLYYHDSTPIVVKIGVKDYTVQTYYITGSVLNKIVPVLDGRNVEGEKLVSDLFSKGVIRNTHGERIIAFPDYRSVLTSNSLECSKIIKCDNYFVRDSCVDDPCFASSSGCDYDDAGERCLKR
ncbi:hypothetical protein HY483_00495 [Candidatus Woesearchaeota archaeon]|nr:hypothetical protein [Candidatus Woesearchaeota archaeon]